MDLSEFLNHDDENIRGVATIIEEARQGLESGDLTRQQFDEIVEDVLEIDRIDTLADDLERKIMIKQAIDKIKTIIGKM